MARILVVVNDLMLSSRVVEPLKASGHDVTLRPKVPEGAPEGTGLTICDLDLVDPEKIVALGTPTLGFYSHTDVETRERALSAGFDLVVPRSRMVRELPDLVQGLLKD